MSEVALKVVAILEAKLASRSPRPVRWNSIEKRLLVQEGADTQRGILDGLVAGGSGSAAEVE